ncbi:MAG TPA: ATP-binding protein [Parvularculaceae bacterium]|nr:ATP-binding protein [Parvularculaceae bacterium]
MLRNAFENVLRNAIRHAPQDSSIEVELCCEGANAVLTISDCGPGIAPDDLSQIFEPFTPNAEGSGLGLAITRQVMRLHGGDVSAENRQSGGLTVQLTLPVVSD